jgi:type 1 glutamine amidotransferase/HEAT repeat protein
MKHKLIFLILTTIILLVLVKPSAARLDAPALKALIVTGQNNHNWKTSSSILKQLLEESGLFSVDIAASPGKGSDMKDFSPDFASYNVVVLDYNGDSWSEQSRRAFVNYVKEGGGVVVYHAANNAFPGWREYNEITGLGGWEGRSEKSGPYVYWQDGKVTRDLTPGIGGYHGAQHDFQVINRDRSHPVTRGLPEKWMHAKDELYSLLRGPAKNLHVLATAYSAVEQSGSGRHEPVLFTIEYGKGRIFHTVLGHAGNEVPPPAMECVGFIVTLRRGAEWAATGRVTAAIPGDFPATTKTTSAPEDVRRWEGFRLPSLDKILTGMFEYKFGRDSGPLSLLENYTRSRLNSPESLRLCEDKLLRFLESAAALDAKQFVCRQLRIMGSAKSVPLLIKMVLNGETSDMARYALQNIPGPVVDLELLKILPQSGGKVKIGIINTLGQRGSPAAVPYLAKLIENPEPACSAAAIAAIGRIGGSRSAEVLTKALKGSNKKIQSHIEDALLRCAEDLFSRNKLKAARGIYEKLGKPGRSQPVRSAALKGLIACSGKKAGKIILEVLKGGETGLYPAAVCRVPLIKDREVIKTLCKDLPNFNVPLRAQLISALTGCDSPAVLPAIVKAADSKEEEVRIAALNALAKQGNASTVYLLAQRAASAKGREQKAARVSLQLLKGKSVDQTIIANLIAQRDPAVQAELLRSTGERRIYRAKRIVISKAKYAKAESRLTALRVLGVICGADDLRELIDILPKVKSNRERKEAESTIAAVAAKIGDEEKRPAAILTALQARAANFYIYDVKARCSLLRILGKTGSSSALPGVKDCAVYKKHGSPCAGPARLYSPAAGG